MANVKESCFCWLAQNELVKGADRAALVKGAKWTKGDTISISFLDGDLSLQKKVASVAAQWTSPGMANLTLDFRKPGDTLIRISFQNPGSWSVIGTTCRKIPKNQPTMNFGWLTPTSDDAEIQRVVLHEFGHALGLIHEHQNPAGGIMWNKAQVYKDLSGPPNNWSKSVIDHNMFETYAKAETNYTQTDAHSIMMYPIPKSWTENGFSVGLNSSLSKTDRDFVHRQY